MYNVVPDGIIATCNDCKRTEFDSSYTRENSELVAHSQMTLEKVKQLKKHKGEKNTLLLFYYQMRYFVVIANCLVNQIVAVLVQVLRDNIKRQHLV